MLQFPSSSPMVDDKSIYRLSRKLKQNTQNIYARLKSITEDSEFVETVFRLYPTVPKYANLRCGLWYHANFDSTCYFKSTDGHTYHWSFSLSRLNLHVLKTALTSHCIMIVDSTRKGKLFPDSFSKTVPIWCCVMNRVLQLLKYGSMSSELKLPTWVHDTERVQIEERMPEWIDTLLKSGIDFTEFVKLYEKPLQCVWISRRTDLDFVDSSFSTDELDFIPVFLVSVSDPDHPIKTTSWEYIQGAGDDHETWSLGLTPQLFWEFKDAILSPTVHNGEECEQVIREILANHRKQSSVSNMQHLYDSSSISLLHISKHGDDEASLNPILPSTKLNSCPLSIGHFSNFEKIEMLNTYFESHLKETSRFICCHDYTQEFSCGKAFSIMDNKKNKRGLEDELASVLQYSETQLASGKELYILGRTGKNEEIAIVIAILCSMFTENYEFIHDKTSREETMRNFTNIDKQFIKKKLMFIQSFVHDASPSRNLIKGLNRYFLS
ncbi:hypothetical protein C9374_004063 [Naegleria lovaniensis]|uniref:Initiator tRNA phosphoribosyl transferase n=1 Tax=Naegleria lovaniensis TaxID=51637 RepID=A0AA88GS82_NAELO|nr:uncharacterized protein C9374_004063 [Naegleria lovaniensis]KAG2383392.1 hypothetical protein C9374_004063 [Naegleria lovaniensis]